MEVFAKTEAREDGISDKATAVEVNDEKWSDSGELTRCPDPSTHVLIHYMLLNWYLSICFFY